MRFFVRFLRIIAAFFVNSTSRTQFPDVFAKKPISSTKKTFFRCFVGRWHLSTVGFFFNLCHSLIFFTFVLSFLSVGSHYRCSISLPHPRFQKFCGLLFSSFGSAPNNLMNLSLTTGPDPVATNS